MIIFNLLQYCGSNQEEAGKGCRAVSGPGKMMGDDSKKGGNGQGVRRTSSKLKAPQLNPLRSLSATNLTGQGKLKGNNS